MSKLTLIGVLDIQGSVAEHVAALKKIGAGVILVKNKEDLKKISGLIIPGGESTTIGKLLKKTGLDEAIRKRARPRGWLSKRLSRSIPPLALWGTCAGAILMAKKVANCRPDNLALMDMEIERNAYGGQTDSFETEIAMLEIGKIPAVFIRAPKIKRTGRKVKILAALNENPVVLRQENLLATMFHPELTEDARMHEYFFTMTKELCRNP